MQAKEISKQDLEDYHSSIIQTNTHLYLASHPNKQPPTSKYLIMHTTTSENVVINHPNRAPQSLKHYQRPQHQHMEQHQAYHWKNPTK